jgi:glycosyltransferase involved in cell wall biosynthesis
MHILFLTDNFPPEVNAPASRTFEHCREWVAAGARVTVITCAPNFPAGKLLAGYRNRLWQRETLEGIEVVRVWTYIAANEGFARRILDYLSFMAAGTMAALFVRRVDVIVGTSPQFFTACAAWFTGFFKRRPYVFELRDLWPESIRAVGAMRSGPVLRWLERLELRLYRDAARVVAVTHAFRDNLASRGIAPAHVEVITNGVDLSRFAPQPKDPALSEALGLHGRFVCGYVGTHGMAHGLEVLLDAAARMAGEPVTLILLGDGARKAALVRDARERGLDNVLFLDSVPKHEVARYWSLLDAAIIHLRPDPTFESVIPSKLFECMGMGLPVLHGVAGESARIVEEEGVGLCFPPGDAQALADGVRRLSADGGLRERCARNAVAAARRYDRRALAERMLSVLRAAAARR